MWLWVFFFFPPVVEWHSAVFAEQSWFSLSGFHNEVVFIHQSPTNLFLLTSGLVCAWILRIVSLGRLHLLGVEAGTLAALEIKLVTGASMRKLSLPNPK